MRRLERYRGNPFDLHRRAVDNKTDEEAQNRLRAIEADIQAEYENHSGLFDRNALEEIIPSANCSHAKIDLESLYSYQNAAIKQFRKDIEAIQANTIKTTCQNCTIDSVSSLDHWLPKESFPEFAVNPNNLFPCCAVCNSLKSRTWIENNRRSFLNLFLDELPEQKYLFVNVIEQENNEFDYNFYLDNRNGIDDRTFQIITSHYRKLNLLERFRRASISKVSELDSLFKVISFPLDVTITTVIQLCQEERAAYGHNYWKSILFETLVLDAGFIAHVDALRT